MRWTTLIDRPQAGFRSLDKCTRSANCAVAAPGRPCNSVLDAPAETAGKRSISGGLGSADCLIVVSAWTALDIAMNGRRIESRYSLTWSGSIIVGARSCVLLMNEFGANRAGRLQAHADVKPQCRCRRWIMFAPAKEQHTNAPSRPNANSDARRTSYYLIVKGMMRSLARSICELFVPPPNGVVLFKDES